MNSSKESHSNTQVTGKKIASKELLRLTTAGSVDDGKSTLIGRLLYDCGQVSDDQLEEMRRVSEIRNDKKLDFSLLTDGLRAEREQGITIDVAHRYFSTSSRQYIITDVPGHEQYTRNMVTGASTADVALILVDARKGILDQSRRHGFIASLLGIPHLLVAVNKMDLVDWSEECFHQIVQEYTEFSRKLRITDIRFVPICACQGDNVVSSSPSMSWYSGPSLLEQLETITIAADQNLVDFRFSVQCVLRPHQDFRGYAGRIASGNVSPGDSIVVLPSGIETTIENILTADGEKKEAKVNDSIVMTFADDVDVGRGDVIARVGNQPEVKRHFDAILCWMNDQKVLQNKNRYILQLGTQRVQAFVDKIHYRINVHTLHREKKISQFELNDIGRVSMELISPLVFDDYVKNRALGGFVLIDPQTHQTVAAGMIQGSGSEHLYETSSLHKQISSNVTWLERGIDVHMRENRNAHQAQCLWLTGLSASGKSTIAKALEEILFAEGKQVYLLDGDNVRHGLCGDLGFSQKERQENIRRVGHVARLFYDAGFVVICSFISPKRDVRDSVKSLFPLGAFHEIFIDCPLEECIKRDPKGLYKKALTGEIPEFTGVSAPYEEPLNPSLTIQTNRTKPLDAIAQIKDLL
ncbi:MAG: adenylyl-sulfate kinase [Spirochaetales bacterium]|nr:adenylyl-sulfate kinase [Spirochaetales bacterium]